MSERQVRFHIRVAAERLARRSKVFPASMIEELEVGGGNARIDIALIGENMIGVEIKSEKDNLSRLEKQALFYAPYFDFLVLVVDISMVDDALEILPKHWGIIATTSKNSIITLRQLRRPAINPERRSSDLLQLLWKEELLLLLGERDCDPTKDKRSKATLRDKIIRTHDPETIRYNCLDIMLKRSNWRIKRLLSNAT